MKRFTLTLFVLAMLLSAVSAQALEFGVDVASQGLSSYTTSANPWARSRTFGGINLRGEVGLDSHWRIGFGWHYASSDGILHGYTTAMGRHDLTVDGRYRYPLFDWVAPYARVGAGVAESHLSMNNWETTNWSPQVQAGLGIELLLPAMVWSKKDKPLPSFGLFTELGWQMVMNQNVTLSTTSSPQPGVSSGDLQLGTLSLNGFLLRFGAAVRF